MISPEFRRRALALGLLAGFGSLGVKLAAIAANPPVSMRLAVAEDRHQHTLQRPDVIDRNGQILATDIPIFWLHANPALILNADEAAEQLSSVLPGLAAAELRKKLSEKSTFMWIRRGLTPKQAAKVHQLGLPGLYITEQRQRVYPAGEGAAHVLGHTSVDNRGLGAIERFIDMQAAPAHDNGTAARPSPLRLTLDLRVQHHLRQELADALSLYGAKAAAGLVMDVNTGEMLALASLPDYDPNRRETALLPDRHNRVLADAYELGSVFKAFTVAMALDSGLLIPQDELDVATPLKVNSFTLHDQHARSQYATVEDILVRSSNTGAARIALLAGPQRQLQFLQRLGLFDTISTEAGETVKAILPPVWRQINMATAAYGHGLAVAPLNFAAAVSTLVNGGFKVEPHIVYGAPRAKGPRLLLEKTSLAMRDLLRQAVERGTGKRARIAGYDIGGKTGTAYKAKAGGYSKQVLNSFFAVVPADKPRYLLFVMLDDPQPETGQTENEAAHNAVPVAARILTRILPVLGIAPKGMAGPAAPSQL